MRNDLEECNVQQDCLNQLPFGQPPTLCVEDFMYAFTTSCNANIGAADSLYFGIDEERQLFVNRLVEFISNEQQAGFEDYCPPVRNMTMKPECYRPKHAT